MVSMWPFQLSTSSKAKTRVRVPVSEYVASVHNRRSSVVEHLAFTSEQQAIRSNQVAAGSTPAVGIFLQKIEGAQ